MRRLLLLILLVLMGFLAVRVGWPWLIAVLTVTSGILSFSLLEQSPSRNRIVFFFTLYVLQALLIAWGIRWYMKRIELTLAARGIDSPVFQVLADSSFLQNFWAVAGGLAIAALLFGGIFLAATLAETARSSNPAQGMHDDTIQMALYRALGLAPARWVVRNGEMTAAKAPKPPQPPDTGPGVIEVQRGHAVILEVDGAVSRVLPAGTRWVKPRERIAMVVPLFGSAGKVVVLHAATRDALQIEDLEITVFHKVSDEGASTAIEDEKSRFNLSTVRDKVWSAGGKTWEGGVVGVTEREARTLIARYTMEELLTLDGPARAKFLQDLQKAINAVTEEYMGVKVTVTGMGTINAPDLAAEKLMARWTAEKDGQIAWNKAVLQNEIVLETAETRRDAFKLLFYAMNDALKNGAEVKDLVAMSFVERMERVESEPVGGEPHDLDALGKLYVVEALKNLTERASNARPQGDSSPTPEEAQFA